MVRADQSLYQSRHVPPKAAAAPAATFDPESSVIN
jgi:hypothetical protein